MPDMRSPIGMADALTAARALELETSEDLGRLSRLLGLLRREEAPEPNAQYVPPEPSSQRDQSKFAATTEDAVTPSLPTPNLPDESRRTVVEQLDNEPAVTVEWELPPVLDPPPPEVAVVPFEPPVPVHQLRAALAMLLRRPRQSQRPDVARLVSTAANCQPLYELPREVEHSLSLGVAVVADVGATMLPLLGDVNHFVEQIQHVAGTPNVLVAWTDDAEGPLNFTDGRPVLLISSFGATRAATGRPGSDRRWRELLDDLLARGVDVLALVPHRRTAVRSAAERIVAWDDLPLVGRGRA
jgi:hypothetical protein